MPQGRAIAVDSLSTAAGAFTRRQHQVAVLIAAGCSNDEVAVELGISAATAKKHADALRHKLGVPRRRQIPRAFLERTGVDLLRAETA
jgi:ATP/maltotriose-dependent transcriptional regulator MalT